MKKISIILLFACLIPLCAKAQISIKETFNSDDKLRLDWEEYADKRGSALVMDGQLVLTCKEKDHARMVFVNLPINVEKDFKISSSIIVKHISDNNWFGISIDDNEFIKLGFFMSEDFLYVGYYENSTSNFGDSDESTKDYRIIKGDGKVIKLKSGKNVTVNTILEKKGKKLIFSINNVKVYEKYHKNSDFFVAPRLGFITEGVSEIKIDEVKIEQESSDEY